MDIYENKKTGKHFIGVNIQKSHGNVSDNSTMVDVETGEIVLYYTTWFKYIGKIENGIFTSIQQVRQILS